MPQLKHILNDIKLMCEDIESPDVVKSINDEFRVNQYMFNNIEKLLKKVNKNLTSRNLPELKINILKTENVDVRRDREGGIDNMYTVVVYTIKIEGDVPEVADYEFIAKIEHGEDGNIINQVPNTSVEKLPHEFKTLNQKCDICNTNRERLNTFILKKLRNSDEASDKFEIGQLITAGSSCLKKFLPLDSVKKFLDYAIQLETLRNILSEYENALSDPSSEYFGERGAGHGVYTYNPETIMMMCCIAYFDNGGNYVSGKSASEHGKTSTLNNALDLINWSESRDEELRRDAMQTIQKYKTPATEMTNKILEWSRDYDFDEAAVSNPSFDSYYNNLKVLLNRPYLERKHLGYYSSLISLYLRNTQDKKEKSESVPIEYYGNIGEKISSIPVTVTGNYSYDSQYGTMYIYLMKDDSNHMFVYKGKMMNDPANPGTPLQKGDSLSLSGTIAKHSLYRDIKQTVIQRPKIGPVK
jgi:hypothetical protein